MWGGGCYNQGMKKHNLYRGFTIIEVVLVLAIAGLIFLMVFLALPALQRSQRDTQRKRDVAVIRAAVENYRSNNKGSIKTLHTYSAGVIEIGKGPLANYLKDGVSRETEWYWISRVYNNGGHAFFMSSNYDHKTIVVAIDGKCSGNNDTLKMKVGSVAILSSLETGLQARDSSFGKFNYCEDL